MCSANEASLLGLALTWGEGWVFFKGLVPLRSTKQFGRGSTPPRSLAAHQNMSTQRQQQRKSCDRNASAHKNMSTAAHKNMNAQRQEQKKHHDTGSEVSFRGLAGGLLLNLALTWGEKVRRLSIKERHCDRNTSAHKTRAQQPTKT